MKKHTISFNDSGLILNGRLTKKQTNGSRLVYLNNHYVVKLETFDRSVKHTQSFNEFTTYQKIEKKDKKYFAQILGFGKIKILDDNYCYIVQKRISKSKEIKRNYQHRKKVKELGEKYKITDLHTNNWYVNQDGLPVIFDLGYSGTFY